MPLVSHLNISAAVAAWLVAARRTHRAIIEKENVERFRSVAASLPDQQLSRLHADYQMLAAFDSNRQFRRKRDACLEEITLRRTACPGSWQKLSRTWVGLS